MTINPIETKYNGYNFRSRLEARWAVFFDKLEVPYEYEVEGFNLQYCSNYLPDFYLPKHDLYLEIKPRDNLTLEIPTKPIELSMSTNKNVIVVFGDPLEYSFCFIEASNISMSLDKHPLWLWFTANGIDGIAIHDQNHHRDEAKAAREARFEFGETPKPKNSGNNNSKDSLNEMIKSGEKYSNNSNSDIAGLLLDNFRETDFCPSVIPKKNRDFLKSLDASYEIFNNLTDSQLKWLLKYYVMAASRNLVPALDSLIS